MTDEVPPPDDEPSVPWADTRAVREERNWPNEDALTGQKHKNRLAALESIGEVTVFLIWVFVLIFACAIFAWAWHQIMPLKWSWLTDAQLSKIQSVIFSGSIGAIVSTLVHRHVND